MKFIVMVCATFFDWVNPVSTNAKPACMNMTRKPAMSVHMMLMAILLWPTVSITSASCGLAASFTVTSLAVPVAAPDGSAAGAVACVCAWAVNGRATVDTNSASASAVSTKRVSRRAHRMGEFPPQVIIMNGVRRKKSGRLPQEQVQRHPPTDIYA